MRPFREWGRPGGWEEEGGGHCQELLCVLLLQGTQMLEVAIPVFI